MNGSMSTVVFICVLTFLLQPVDATSGETSVVVGDTSEFKAMEEVVLSSEEDRQTTMINIMRGMSVPKAVEVLQKHNLTTPGLAQVMNMALSGNTNLRRQPKGYSGIDGARKLLNDMIFESMTNYDNQVADCTEYYAAQCLAMDMARGEISAANYEAAKSRSLILAAQSTINRCEVDIPARRLELAQHDRKCKHGKEHMSDRMKTIKGDLAVMDMILSLIECDKKNMLQMKSLALSHCQDQCTKKSFIKFSGHQSLQQKVSQLKSSLSQELLHDTFSDLFEGIESLSTLEVTQTPLVNKTKFNNPPVPRTLEPADPCTDPDKGAPSNAHKRAAKCTLTKSPQCQKLNNRFEAIRAGIEEEKEQLREDMASFEKYCEETAADLKTQIKNDEATQAEAQEDLSSAMEKEASSGETARQNLKKHDSLDEGLKTKMKTCSENYIKLMTEKCALKKIRGELYKMKGGGHSAFFQDCEVSKWDPEECSKVCSRGPEDGGVQKLTRSVLTHPNGGTKCLPLAAMRSCNNQPCPVDCKLSSWSGWSKCSAECGGGVQQRLREVKVAMKYGGKPCGGTSESRSCNGQACEMDCKLSSWTKWSSCSKDCDGGSMKRQKFVFRPAKGAGKCPSAWQPGRLQFKKCNMKRCKLEVGAKTVTCKKELDVVLLIDGSGSLGKKGWAAEIVAANTLVDAFNVKDTQARMAVILYSGPRTWGGVFKCFAKNTKKVDRDRICGIKMVTHFTKDLKKVKQLINGLSWPKGSTLTSLALVTAKAELALGRKSAQSVAIVFTDGRPLSYRKTEMASASLRKAARLVWVPVTKYAPLAKIKKWATRRWQENVVRVSSFKKLEDPEVITHIIADICPKKNPKVKFSRR